MLLLTGRIIVTIDIGLWILRPLFLLSEQIAAAAAAQNGRLN